MLSLTEQITQVWAYRCGIVAAIEKLLPLCEKLGE